MKTGIPQDESMSTVRVGKNGQNVIPEEGRDIFGIRPGDSLPLLADKKKGVAIVGAPIKLRRWAL